MNSRPMLLALTLLMPVLCSGCRQRASSSGSAPGHPTAVTELSAISVPQGQPFALDGTLSPGEWDSARVDHFADGSELLLMHNEGYLYLGIRANTPEMIVANVFVHHGDEIAILHSSAALGTALYREEAAGWQQTQAFDWRCRSTDHSEQAQSERHAFLQQEHWVAANSLMGSPNELEYQIAVSREGLRLAVSLVRASKPDVKTPWPAALDDDCVLPTPGGLPEQLQFSPDRWAVIGLP
jgi:hypothetical protein